MVGRSWWAGAAKAAGPTLPSHWRTTMNSIFLKVPVLIIVATLGFATDAWLTSAERPQVMNAALEQLHGGSQQVIQIEQSHQLRSLRRVGIAGLVVLCGLALF